MFPTHSYRLGHKDWSAWLPNIARRTGLAHVEGYCVETNGLSAYYWLRVAKENLSDFGHRSRALVEKLRSTVKTDNLEAVEQNVAIAVKNNKLLTSQHPVEFVKCRVDCRPWRPAG